MGITAENVAKKHELTREAQDAFALNSQQKAIKAAAEKKFEEQTVKIGTLAHDEYINEKSSKEGLAKLKPAFAKGTEVILILSSLLEFVIVVKLCCTPDFPCSCQEVDTQKCNPRKINLL